MRELKLVSPRFTFAGTVASVKLLDSKFESRGRVSVKLQAYDAQGNKLGEERTIKGSASDRTDLHGSANALVVAHFGAISEV